MVVDEPGDPPWEGHVGELTDEAVAYKSPPSSANLSRRCT
jgi:hypothetical protein